MKKLTIKMVKDYLKTQKDGRRFYMVSQRKCLICAVLKANGGTNVKCYLNTYVIGEDEYKNRLPVPEKLVKLQHDAFDLKTRTVSVKKLKGLLK